MATDAGRGGRRRSLDPQGRRALFEEIWAEDQRFAARDRAHMGYDYAVPGAWQGASKRVRVIGDKKGGRSSWWLHDEPALLDRLYEVVALPLRFIHVSRSPWDNIATIVRRGMDHTRAIAWYFETCDAVAGIKARIPAADVLDLRHEDFLRDPRAHLRGLCRFLEVRADEAWIEACVAVVDTRPRRSRHELPWSAEQIAWVQREVVRFPWFRESDLDLAGEA